MSVEAVSRQELEEAAKEIILAVGVHVISMRELRHHLENKFQQNMSGRKKELHEIVVKTLNDSRFAENLGGGADGGATYADNDNTSQGSFSSTTNSYSNATNQCTTTHTSRVVNNNNYYYSHTVTSTGNHSGEEGVSQVDRALNYPANSPPPTNTTTNRHRHPNDYYDEHPPDYCYTDNQQQQQEGGNDDRSLNGEENPTGTPYSEEQDVDNNNHYQQEGEEMHYTNQERKQDRDHDYTVVIDSSNTQYNNDNNGQEQEYDYDNKENDEVDMPQPQTARGQRSEQNHYQQKQHITTSHISSTAQARHQDSRLSQQENNTVRSNENSRDVTEAVHHRYHDPHCSAKPEYPPLPPSNGAVPLSPSRTDRDRNTTTATGVTGTTTTSTQRVTCKTANNSNTTTSINATSIKSNSPISRARAQNETASHEKEKERDEVQFLMERLLDEQDKVEDLQRQLAALRSAQGRMIGMATPTGSTAGDVHNDVSFDAGTRYSSSLPSPMLGAVHGNMGMQRRTSFILGAVDAPLADMLTLREELLSDLSRLEDKIAQRRLHMVMQTKPSEETLMDATRRQAEVNARIRAAFRAIGNAAFPLESVGDYCELYRVAQHAGIHCGTFRDAYRVVYTATAGMHMLTGAGTDDYNKLESSRYVLLKAIREMVVCYNLCSEELHGVEELALLNVAQHEGSLAALANWLNNRPPQPLTLLEYQVRDKVITVEMARARELQRLQALKTPDRLPPACPPVPGGLRRRCNSAGVPPRHGNVRRSSSVCDSPAPHPSAAPVPQSTLNTQQQPQQQQSPRTTRSQTPPVVPTTSTLLGPRGVLRRPPESGPNTPRTRNRRKVVLVEAPQE